MPPLTTSPTHRRLIPARIAETLIAKLEAAMSVDPRRYEPSFDNFLTAAAEEEAEAAVGMLTSLEAGLALGQFVGGGGQERVPGSRACAGVCVHTVWGGVRGVR